VLALGALALAAPAAAAKDKAAAKNKTTKHCARAVIDDWWGNNRIDEIFPLRCYRQAVKALPLDVVQYSSAKDDILRALQYARRGEPDPGDKGSSPGTGSGDGTGGGSGGPGSEGGSTASGPVDTSGPSSVPIPLIILAGLATLLLALGAAGYLTRRMAARRNGEEPPSIE
jgi:uncharacterized membrane protein YgcG